MAAEAGEELGVGVTGGAEMDNRWKQEGEKGKRGNPYCELPLDVPRFVALANFSFQLSVAKVGRVN